LNSLLRLLLQGQNREIFMPARFAAKRRDAQISPHKSEQRVHVFGRNALQGEIPADRAVGVERIAQRHQPGVETGSTTLATPGVDTNCAQNVIGLGLAARSARTFLLADGTLHLSRRIPLRMPHSIGQMPRGGKGRRYQLPGYNSFRGCYAELYR